MATILLRDDFDGTGPLAGRAPNINTLGPEANWGNYSTGEVSGGVLHTGTYMVSANAVQTGTGMRLTFRWMPPSNPEGYPTGPGFGVAGPGPIYPIGINFGPAAVWTRNTGSGVQLHMFVYADYTEEGSIPASFVANEWHDGELIATDGLQRLTFLGQTIERNVPLDMESISASFYMNANADLNGAYGKLDFLQIETVDSNFWTKFVNTTEQKTA